MIFYSPDLFDKIPYGKGRHYSFLDPAESFTIVVQGDRKEFTLHTSLPEDTDFKAIIARLVGYPCDIKILHVLTGGTTFCSPNVIGIAECFWPATPPTS